MLEELGSGASNPSALAFLANAVKDEGRVDATLRLFRLALDKDPGNTAYALNYVHALELELSSGAALREVAEVFKRAAASGRVLGGGLQSLKVRGARGGTY